jgi:hypothetical protein
MYVFERALPRRIPNSSAAIAGPISFAVTPRKTRPDASASSSGFAAPAFADFAAGLAFAGLVALDFAELFAALAFATPAFDGFVALDFAELFAALAFAAGLALGFDFVALDFIELFAVLVFDFAAGLDFAELFAALAFAAGLAFGFDFVALDFVDLFAALAFAGFDLVDFGFVGFAGFDLDLRDLAIRNLSCAASASALCRARRSLRGFSCADYCHRSGVHRVRLRELF